MGKSSYKIRLGIFIVLGTVLLIIALYYIGSRQNLLGANQKIYANFNNINGLQMGNNVRYSGIDVGTVSGIEMFSDTLIVVEMRIDTKTGSHIKKDAVASIGSDGLVGSMIINILPGKTSKEPVKSGDTIETFSKMRSIDMLNTLNVTNENAALLTADLLKITSSILEGKGTLGILLKDSMMANDLRLTVSELKKAGVRTNQTLDALNSKINSPNYEKSAIGILLNDTVTGGQIKTIVYNVERSTKDLELILHDIQVFTDSINQRKGLMNYLLNNKDAVNLLDSTFLNINESAKKLNENMEALKHNFLLRGYFRKLERNRKN